MHWAERTESADFVLDGGEIQVTSPSERAYKKMEELAARLNANVIGEESNRVPSPNLRPGVFAGRETWLGWPILVIMLLALLVWRW